MLTTFAVASANAFTTASTDDDEVAENFSGGSGSIAAGTGGEHSVASLDLSGDDFVNTALQGMGGSPTIEPSVMASMPGVLGDDSSSSEGEGAGGGNASPSKDVEADTRTAAVLWLLLLWRCLRMRRSRIL
jgi:hypothetical protein